MLFKKVLCVDDDLITLMLCKKVLIKAQFSHQIDVVNNGEQALDYFDSILKSAPGNSVIDLPQIIFLDLNMPIMNGWEFLDIFSRSNYFQFFSKIKVVVLSSTIDPSDIKKAQSYPMVVHFLSKPITKEMLEFLF